MAINHRLERHEISFVDYIKKTINKKDICLFDVGTNRGLYIDLFLNFENNVDIHCFEPNTILFDELSKKYTNKVTLNNIGISNIKGEVEFYELPDPNIDGCSSLIERPAFKENSWVYNVKKIKVDSIDNYCFDKKIQHIDFLKIDVEGAELMALKGCSNMLDKKQISYIQFEYGKTFEDANTTLSELYEFILKKGYKLFSFKDDTFIEIDFNNIKEFSEIPYCDFIIKQ